MSIAIVLGIWVVVSILITPLIGYFLFVLSSSERLPKRYLPQRPFRPLNWNYPTARRQETLRHAANSKFHRRQTPRTG
jgi:hypothetical protein